MGRGQETNGQNTQTESDNQNRQKAKGQNRKHGHAGRILKWILLLMIVIVIVIGGWQLTHRGSTSHTVVITSAELEEAIYVSQLSTAEFVYNGIAEKYDEDDPDEVVCYIAYNATVKVGIEMEDVTFEIDDEAKTITPILPQIEVNIAQIDEDSLSYIPQDPDLSLNEIITLCKEDAITEANASEELYAIAEENLQSVIEALLSPLLESAGYTLTWESSAQDETATEAGAYVAMSGTGAEAETAEATEEAAAEAAEKAEAETAEETAGATGKAAAEVTEKAAAETAEKTATETAIKAAAATAEETAAAEATEKAAAETTEKTEAETAGETEVEATEKATAETAIKTTAKAAEDHVNMGTAVDKGVA